MIKGGEESKESEERKNASQYRNSVGTPWHIVKEPQANRNQ